MFNEVVIRFCENPTYECRQDQILFANLTDRFKLELRFVPVKTRFSILSMHEIDRSISYTYESKGSKWPVL